MKERWRCFDIGYSFSACSCGTAAVDLLSDVL